VVNVVLVFFSTGNVDITTKLVWCITESIWLRLRLYPTIHSKDHGIYKGICFARTKGRGNEITWHVFILT
jgi:hypothetical protein